MSAELFNRFNGLRKFLKKHGWCLEQKFDTELALIIARTMEREILDEFEEAEAAEAGEGAASQSTEAPAAPAHINMTDALAAVRMIEPPEKPTAISALIGCSEASVAEMFTQSTVDSPLPEPLPEPLDTMARPAQGKRERELLQTPPKRTLGPKRRHVTHGAAGQAPAVPAFSPDNIVWNNLHAISLPLATAPPTKRKPQANAKRGGSPVLINK